MPQRPRIGISLDTGQLDEHRKVYEIGADYVEAILRADGSPILLPHTHDPDLRSQMLADLDGLVIPGGRDINPALYAQSLHPSTSLMDPLRQDFDLAILALAEQRHLPTLGICLGCQLMNVARRGTLHQSIAERFPESPVTHARAAQADPSQNPTRSSFHRVMIRPGTHLAAIYRTDELETNSRHRQAIDKLGRGLIPTAFAPDGILEAIEDLSLPFWIGVQWHPENLPGTPHDKLFSALVAAASSRPSAAPPSP